MIKRYKGTPLIVFAFCHDSGSPQMQRYVTIDGPCDICKKTNLFTRYTFS